MLNEQEREVRNSVIDAAAFRFEKKLGDEISGVRVELANTEKRFEKKLGEEIGKVDKRLSEEIHYLREDMVKGDETLRTEIQAAKTDTIRWMFIFWIGQVGALIGILFAFFS